MATSKVVTCPRCHGSSCHLGAGGAAFFCASCGELFGRRRSLLRRIIEALFQL